MRPRTVRACHFPVALLAARPALACGTCVDQSIRISLPFAGSLMLLCLVWIVAVFIARRVMKRRAPDSSAELPMRRAPRILALLATAGFVGLAFLSMGSILGPSLVVGTVWLIYVLVRVIADAARGRRGGVARPFFILNCVFLALALAAFPVSFVRARTTRATIRLLDYAARRHRRVLVPRLIARGEPAVGPLVEAVELALKDRSYSGRNEKLEACLFCLGRIGGPRAAELLGNVVARNVDFKEFGDRDWQRTACFGYAECARAEAVPGLMQLYERCGEAPAKEMRWAVLAALATTGSREGVTFVLDRMDVLLERAAGGGVDPEPSVAYRLAHALVSRAGPDGLRAVNVHDGGPVGDGEALAKRWEDEREQVKRYWLSALK